MVYVNQNLTKTWNRSPSEFDLNVPSHFHFSKILSLCVWWFGVFSSFSMAGIENEISDNQLRAEIITEIKNEGLTCHGIDPDRLIPFRLVKLPAHIVKIEEEGGQTEFPSGSQSESRGRYSHKYYKQFYRTAWESMPDFKGWLKGVHGEPTRAYCTYCQKTLHAHRLSLLKHTCTIRHQKAAQLHDNSESSKLNSETRNLTTVPGRTVNLHSIDQMNQDQSQSSFSEDAMMLEEDDNSEEQENQSELIFNAQGLQDGNEDEEEQDEPDESEELDQNLQENAPADNEDTSMSHGPVSTNVTDILTGKPVQSLPVSLYKLIDGRWTFMNESSTNNKGQCSNLYRNAQFSPGRYKLHYDVDKYFEGSKYDSPFPFIETVFDVTLMKKYHFTLLLSPNSYSTYRSQILHD